MRYPQMCTWGQRGYVYHQLMIDRKIVGLFGSVGASLNIPLFLFALIIISIIKTEKKRKKKIQIDFRSVFDDNS